MTGLYGYLGLREREREGGAGGGGRKVGAVNISKTVATVSLPMKFLHVDSSSNMCYILLPCQDVIITSSVVKSLDFKKVDDFFQDWIMFCMAAWMYSLSIISLHGVGLFTKKY